ncbi:hypothetical protein Tco_0138606, partial [Tanacetum coccineum]
PGRKPVSIMSKNRVSLHVNRDIESHREKLEWKKMVKCKVCQVRLYTALTFVLSPRKTVGESVLGESCSTRRAYNDTIKLLPTVVNTSGRRLQTAVAIMMRIQKKFTWSEFKDTGATEDVLLLTTLGLRGSRKKTANLRLNTPAEDPFVIMGTHRPRLPKNYGSHWNASTRPEDAGTKKFVVARFLDYKMVDSKAWFSQVQDLQVLMQQFKNYLKHKRKEMSVEDLVVRLRIEEDNKLAQKDSYTPDSAKANMVEHAGSYLKVYFQGANKKRQKEEWTRRAKGSINTSVGGLLLGAHSTCAVLYEYVELFQSRLDNSKSCIWATLQLLISRVKRCYFEDDIRERAHR